VGDIGNAAAALGRGAMNAAGAVGRGVAGAAGAVGSGVASAAGAIGGLLPDWIRSLFTSAPSDVERRRNGAEQEATRAGGEVGQAAQQTQAETQQGADQRAATAHREVASSDRTSAAEDARARALSSATRAGAVAGLQAVATVGGPALAPFVNPAIAIARPGALDAAADRIGTAGARVAGEVGRGVGPGLRQAASAFDGYEWNCDFAEVASRAGGVGRGVFNAAVGLADVATSGRASKVLAFAGDLAGRVRGVGQKVAAGVRGYATQLRGFLGRKMQPILDGVRDVGARVRAGAQRVADGVRRFAGDVRDRAVAGFNRLKTRITDRVHQIGAGLRNAGTALLGRLQRGLQIAGAMIERLLPGAGAVLERVRAAVERGVARARAIAEEAKARLVAARDRVVTYVRTKADEALRAAIRLGQAVGERVRQARQWISDHRRQILMAIPGGPLVAAVGAAAVAGANRIRAIAGNVATKASGAVCTAVGDVGGPCVNQYLPNPGGGQTASITVTSSADVTLPLHEVGVPCSLRLGRGAKVTIKRQGDTFTVTIKGDGSATAVENLEASAQGTASVALPPSGPGTVWQRLGGPNTTPPPAATPALAGSVPIGGGGGAVPAPAGAAPAPNASQLGQQAAGGSAAGVAGGAGSPGASFEGGVTGTVEQEYQFTAGGNACAGLGGLLSLNAALGIAGALPEPLCSLARSGVQGAFLPQLQKSTFTAAMGGSASIKLFEGGGAEAAAKVTAELSAAASRRRATEADRTARAGAIDADGFIDELTLGGKLSGETTFSLPGAGPVAGLSGAAKPELSVALTLVYARSQGRIEPEKAEAKAAIEVSLSNLDLGALRGLLIGPTGDTAVDRLRRFRDAQGAAKVNIETTIAVNDLDVLYRQMEAYFANPDAVTVQGTIDLVRQHLGTGVTRETKVTLTRSMTTELKAGGSATVEGATLGANAGASIEQAVETQIYPAA